MKSLHVEGTGWLYRVSPRLKLVTLMVFSIALFLTRDLLLLGCAVVVAAAILRETRLQFREIGLRLRPVMLTILLVAAFSYLLLPIHDASVNLLRLTALAFLATAVTITVSISQFMDEIALAAARWKGWGWSRRPISGSRSARRAVRAGDRQPLPCRARCAPRATSRSAGHDHRAARHYDVEGCGCHCRRH